MSGIQPRVEVGMGATQQIGSDRYPYTVIEVLSPKRIIVQADNFKRTDSNGLSESQTYEYAPNPNGKKYALTYTKNGWGCGSGSYRLRFYVGHRNAYQDPSY